ncbi:hypothetical protein OGAPHI_001107 [Ogataea philodendri]|uniref:Uncharacterized protein n=1 Tax=Ogataea philodendri TaxID=1378263 RepID=A0A9P8PEL5_9ASCO|nr:uncharacterized protein OGAPHI_001107 [Ogataea philodendri]KAH3670592.1 hypothetical protein OGAPHI_001107 [Ogataea philodendri]
MTRLDTNHLVEAGLWLEVGHTSGLLGPWVPNNHVGQVMSFDVVDDLTELDHLQKLVAGHVFVNSVELAVKIDSRSLFLVRFGEQLVIARLARQIVDKSVVDVVDGQVRVEEPVELPRLGVCVGDLNGRGEAVWAQLDSEQQGEIVCSVVPLGIEVFVGLFWTESKLGSWRVFLGLAQKLPGGVSCKTVLRQVCEPVCFAFTENRENKRDTSSDRLCAVQLCGRRKPQLLLALDGPGSDGGSVQQHRHLGVWVFWRHKHHFVVVRFDRHDT